MKKCFFRNGVAPLLIVAGVALSGLAITEGAKKLLGSGVPTFVKKALEKPLEKGSLFPCSVFVAKEITTFVVPNSKKTLHILETGAGTGCFSRKIVEKLGTSSYVLDIVEIDQDFCTALQKEFAMNPKVNVYQADLTTWISSKQYDIIISAIPFNALPENKVKSILNNYEQMILPGGKISYVELIGLPEVKKAFSFGKDKEEFQQKLACVADFKDKHLHKTSVVLLNIPPIYVHHLTL